MKYGCLTEFDFLCFLEVKALITFSISTDKDFYCKLIDRKPPLYSEFANNKYNTANIRS